MPKSAQNGVMKTLYSNLLEKLGLNRAEMEVYDYLLRSGTLPASIIATKVGLSRTNTYNVVVSLRAKGLVEEEDAGVKKLFSACHPDSLKGLIELNGEALATVQADL